MAITDTPTSAKTAAHILARPISPNTMTSALTLSAKMMFCQTIRRVRRAMSVTPPTLYRRTYEALVRDCRRHLNLYIFTAMERARTACGDRVELYFARYPFNWL